MANHRCYPNDAERHDSRTYDRLRRRAERCCDRSVRSKGNLSSADRRAITRLLDAMTDVNLVLYHFNCRRLPTENLVGASFEGCPPRAPNSKGLNPGRPASRPINFSG